ncbi:uncharacterized protein [Argopecten irradians]|uniref:uncharacterized protein n=1 Tax=Argopecten irradians TaxID=31199 RepID=UPI0037226E1E
MGRECIAGIVVGVVVAILVIVLCVVLIPRNEDSVSTSSDNNVFRESFSAFLDINTIEYKDLGSKKGHLKVEWSSETSRLNFQQTDVISPNFDLSFQQTFTVAYDKATIGVSDSNSSINSCLSELPLSQWYGVFNHIVTKDTWINPSKSDGCPGDAWFTELNDDTIEICTSSNKLQYVTFQDTRATVSSWTNTFKRDITIAANTTNGPCQTVTIRSSCENNFDPPKVTRDAGTSPKMCLFVHGAGETPSVNTVRQDLASYWGKIKSYTFNCVSHKFLHYDSKTNGWDSDTIHRLFCDAAAVNGTIRNTVLFSHSMGNLVIAAALHSNKCTFDQRTSRWFSSQGPWKGSAAANKVSDICTNPTFPQRIIRKVLRWNGYCKSNANVEQKAYTTLKTNYISSTGVRFNDLQAKGRSYVSGVMCGTSSWGEKVGESLGLWFIQHYTNIDGPNDGMVSFDSCKLKTDVNFQDRMSSAYYKDKFNHADGTCRNGGCPCQWYKYMH